MSRITQELLRKRSEHNQMCLTTLEEISLHQQELIKIENLDILCRHLKILYLQNNIIDRMENLNKLKELEYLNLALNNISRIENIELCESLKKLDMTVNFIDVFDIADSVKCLSKLPCLKQIYLTGNPCEEWVGCKDFVIANVPQLECYNGENITPSTRIKAVQNIAALEASLYEAIEKRSLELKQEELQEQKRKQQAKYMTQEQKNNQKVPYTRQMRRQMYTEMAQEKQKKEREKNPQRYIQEKQSSMYTKDGDIRQCNEGRFKFRLKEFEDPDYSIFELEVPKHLSTEQLTVNIDPKWVSVRVKTKLTQLKLSEQILVEKSKCERSQITGFLVIKMLKVTPHEFLRTNQQKQKLQKKRQEAAKIQKQAEQKAKRLRLCDQYQKRMEQIDNEIPDLE